MGNQNSKQKILLKGAELVHLKGYNNTGLKEILDYAGVPKGSFYFYFKSKEEFGLELLEFHFSFFRKLIVHYFNNTEIDPVNRIKLFFKDFKSLMLSQQCKLGCPIGNIIQEMSSINDNFREKLTSFYKELIGTLNNSLKEAQDNGEISDNLDTYKISEFIINSWQGSIMEMKLLRDIKPLELFEQIVLNNILQLN